MDQKGIGTGAIIGIVVAVVVVVVVVVVAAVFLLGGGKTYLTQSQFITEAVNYFPNYNVGDVVYVKDKITGITYEANSTWATFESTGTQQWQFEGILSGYNLGDDVVMTFHVTSHEGSKYPYEFLKPDGTSRGYPTIAIIQHA